MRAIIMARAAGSRLWSTIEELWAARKSTVESEIVHKTDVTTTIYDGLGSDEVREITVADLKWRFFALGLQLGIALQMFFICTVLVVLQASNEGAIERLSRLYYPLFRALFLLSFFGILFAIQLFVWKRIGIDYTALLNVSGGRTNYHALVRGSTTLMSIVFIAFIFYWLSITAHLTPFTHVWPCGALLLSFVYLVLPLDWMPEWHDAAQRGGLLRAVGRALLAPFVHASFADTFLADTLCSMPKLAADLLQVSCIYATGEAFAAGEWDAVRLKFEHEPTVCNMSNPAYSAAFSVLSLLPFYIRFMQCARALFDHFSEGKQSAAWRKQALNMLKYTSQMFVIAVSLCSGTWNGLWLCASIFSTLFSFAWDVLVDWGLGPQPVRRLTRRLIGEPKLNYPHLADPSSATYWIRSVRALPTAWYVGGVTVDLTFRLGWAIYISPGRTRRKAATRNQPPKPMCSSNGPRLHPCLSQSASSCRTRRSHSVPSSCSAVPSGGCSGSSGSRSGSSRSKSISVRVPTQVKVRWRGARAWRSPYSLGSRTPTI